MLQLEGDEPTTQNIRRYQAERLGRQDGNTLLTELMHIPKPKVHRWCYEELIPRFASSEARRPYYLRGPNHEHIPSVISVVGKRSGRTFGSSQF